MYVCMCGSAYVCMCVGVHMYVCMCVGVHMYVCMCVGLHMYVYECTPCLSCLHIYHYLSENIIMLYSIGIIKFSLQFLPLQLFDHNTRMTLAGLKELWMAPRTLWVQLELCHLTGLNGGWEHHGHVVAMVMVVIITWITGGFLYNILRQL